MPARTWGQSRQSSTLAATRRWTHTPAEPPNCPRCGVLGVEFNSEWVALQVLGISCLRVNVHQKDKDGHFTGHWFLLPADQPHYMMLLLLCTKSSVMQFEVAPVEMLLLCLFPPANTVSITAMSQYIRILMFAVMCYPH